MHGSTEPAVDEYILSLLPARDSVLQEMDAQAASVTSPSWDRQLGVCCFSMRGSSTPRKFLSWVPHWILHALVCPRSG
jgi:hypothetical protein